VGPLSGKITNTSAAGDTTLTYDTEMLSLDLNGGSPILGAIMVRESPTKQSLGKHTIRSDPRGYRISSFFDVFLEFSLDDGQTWNPGSHAMRVLASMPPAVPGSLFASKVGSNILVQWQNNFTLQSTTDLKIPFTDVAGPVTSGSFMTPMSETAMFFRLRN